MRIFITLLITIFSQQLVAEVYSWQDEKGITHFSQTKPSKTAANIKTMPIIKDLALSGAIDTNVAQPSEQTPPIADAHATHQLSEDFLLGDWVSTNEGAEKQQWVIKKDGVFSIQQTKNSKTNSRFTGQWQLIGETIKLSIMLKSETIDGIKKSDFISQEKLAEIADYQKDRLLINFNGQQFWLARRIK